MDHAATRTEGPLAGPRTAVVWEVLHAELARAAGRSVAVVDVGGGTGGFAVPLARRGHRVTVVDPSPDALAALSRRAAEAGVADRVVAVQGDGDRLGSVVPAGSADLVLCHSVLEVADDPAQVVRAVAATLRPGGAVSVLVPNRPAAVLARAMAGHLDAAWALATDPHGRADPRDPLRRRFDAAGAVALLRSAGLSVEAVHGVRVLTDLIPATVAEADPATLRELEVRLSTESPYREIAAQIHVLARKAGDGRPAPAPAHGAPAVAGGTDLPGG
ncbi:MAG: methyltransferase domain-containing protein [Micromonosporaceae bacterium]